MPDVIEDTVRVDRESPSEYATSFVTRSYVKAGADTDEV